jgi:hypothetical protein
MSAVPVNAITRGTSCKPLLSEINVWGNFVEGFVFIDVAQRCIAFDTARENVEVFEIECPEHLLDLFSIVVALDEKGLRLQFAGNKAGIPRQYDSIFIFCDPDDFVILEHIRISDVEAEHSQPSRQFADHDIRDESNVRHSLHTTWNINAHQVQSFSQPFADEIDDENIKEAFSRIFFGNDSIAVIEEIEPLSQHEGVLRK